MEVWDCHILLVVAFFSFLCLFSSAFPAKKFDVYFTQSENLTTKQKINTLQFKNSWLHMSWKHVWKILQGDKIFRPQMLLLEDIEVACIV